MKFKIKHGKTVCQLFISSSEIGIIGKRYVEGTLGLKPKVPWPIRNKNIKISFGNFKNTKIIKDTENDISLIIPEKDYIEEIKAFVISFNNSEIIFPDSSHIEFLKDEKKIIYNIIITWKISEGTNEWKQVI